MCVCLCAFTDLNLQDKLGLTALHHTIDGNQVAALNILVAHGADTSVKNHRDMAPIHHAVEMNNCTMLQVGDDDLSELLETRGLHSRVF